MGQSTEGQLRNQLSRTAIKKGGTIMKSMKKARHLIAMLTAAALLFLLPSGYTTLKASAAQPVTYAVKYVEDQHRWLFQANTSTFDTKYEGRSLYYMQLALKDGDLVVVYNDSTESATLDLGTAHLSNLTVASANTFTVIYSGDIDDCYVFAGGACSINSNVKNAYVYDSSICNFNKNVEELNIYVKADKMTSTIGCGGIVNHLNAVSTSGEKIFYDLYNFDKAALNIQSGLLLTSSEKYGQPTADEYTIETFDYVRYADDYPDLKAAFGYDAKALFNHYLTCGVYENRKAHPVYGEFNYSRYASDYPDVKAVYGEDPLALYNHYITCGVNESRKAYTRSGQEFKVK